MMNKKKETANEMELYKRFLLIIAAVSCAAAVICGVLIAKTNTERRLYGETHQQRVVTESDLPLLFPEIPGQNIPYRRISSDRLSAAENVLAASCRRKK